MAPPPPTCADDRTVTTRLRILALAPNRWDGPWMNRQQLLSRLGRRHAVLYSTGPLDRAAALNRPRLTPRFVRHDQVLVDDQPSWMARALRQPLFGALTRRRLARRWRHALASDGQSPLVMWVSHPIYRPFVPHIAAD